MTVPAYHPIELVSAGHIPAIAELAQLDQWVAWKYLTRKGKVDKPPVSPHTGRITSHSNPADWGSYAQACAHATTLAGIGFVFHHADPYSGVDLDGCREPQSGAIEDWAQRIIDRLHSYTEISPSQTGVKIFVRGTLTAALTHELGPHKGIEIYSERRYFTVTHQHLAGTPLEIHDAQAELEQLQRELKPAAPAPSHPIRRASPGEQATDRLSARETIAAANRANDLGSYLESQGAQLIRTRGEQRYYSGLQGEQHVHDYTFTISPARDGNGQIGYSYSPNGKLSKSDFPRGFRFFDAYLAIEHAGDRIAALKALSPSRAPNPVPARDLKLPIGNCPEYLAPAHAERRAADRERKRAARLSEATHTIADVDARAQQDAALTPCDRAVLIALFEVAGTRDWCRPSKTRLIELTGYSLGSIKRSLTRLRALGYIDSKGAGGTSQSTAIRTFLRGSFESQTITESKHESESIQTLLAREGARSPQSDLAAELVDIDQVVADALPKSETRFGFEQPDRDLLSYVRRLAKELGDVAVLLVDYDELSTEQLLDEAARLEVALDQVSVLGSNPKRVSDLNPAVDNAAAQLADGGQGDSQLEKFSAGGAWYDPSADWTAGGVLDLTSWRDPRAVCAQTPGELADVADVPEAEPMVRCPPVEPKAAAQYWALKNKRPVNREQARIFRRRLRDLEIWLPISQALASAPPAPADARPSRRRRPADGARAAPPLTSSSAPSAQALDMFAGVLT